jgi:RNA polymerase primary sigma factor
MIAEQLSTANLFLREVNRFKRLTPNEEVELAKAREDGELARAELAMGVAYYDKRIELEDKVLRGIEASEKLTNANLRLVVSIARKYRGRGVPESDLWQEGSIGLQIGISQYDWRKGFRFSTYVYWWIRKAITAAIPSLSRNIRIPAHIYQDILKVMAAARVAEQNAIGDATEQEISKITGIDVKRVSELITLAKGDDSLSAPLKRKDNHGDGDDVDPIENTIEDKSTDVYNQVELLLLKDILERAIDSELNEKEQYIVRLRFGFIDGLRHSLPDVGKKLGITRERVRQVEMEALEKLKNYHELAGYAS